MAVDILSGLPATQEGYKHILLITDYFTKWAEAYPLMDAEAPTCMRVLYNQFFARFGLPRQLHSDQGKNFESKLFHELCNLAGISKTKTTPFHPQSDGQTERMNRTLLQMLRATTQDDPQNWPHRLDTVMAAYRMTPHKVTGISPNLAMLGREVLLPATLIAKPPEEPSQVTVPFVSDLRENIRRAHTRVREATKVAANTQKTYYNRQIKGPPFAVNQLVWLFWPRPPLRQRFRKLQKLWTGPWRIERFKTDVVVELRHVHKQTKQTVHVDRLSPCRAAVEHSNFNNTPEASEEYSQDFSSTSSSRIAGETEHQSAEPFSVPQSTDNSQTPVPVSRPRRTRRIPVRLEPYVLSQ